jgi:hypothetical protein
MLFSTRASNGLVLTMIRPVLPRLDRVIYQEIFTFRQHTKGDLRLLWLSNRIFFKLLVVAFNPGGPSHMAPWLRIVRGEFENLWEDAMAC